jgi:hypothetical protein
MTLVDRDLFIMVPTTLDILHHPDYKSSYYEVFTAILARMGTSPKQDNFCVCWPSIDTLCEKFGHSRDTVMVATAWLDRNGYLFTRRRRRDSNIYTVVIRRERFLDIRQREGQDKAEKDYLTWLEEQKAVACGATRSTAAHPEVRSPSSSYSKPPEPYTDPGWPEVVGPPTSGPTKKSAPLLPDLDSSTTGTKSKDHYSLQRDLLKGPFSRRVFD